jgi:O-antigen ligase
VTKEFTAFLKAAGVIFFALAWLLPNHYPPWASFQSEAWASAACLGFSAWIIWRFKGRLHIPLSCVVLSVIALTPWLQFAGNQISFFGTAWIHSLYLGGLAGCFFIGHQTARHPNGILAQWLFSSVVLASFLTIGLQMLQWFDVTDHFDILYLWVSDIEDRRRTFGNLNQPNNASSLHVMAIAGVLWLRNKRFFNTYVAGLLICWLCLGIAMTGSRAGILSFIVLALAQSALSGSRSWSNVDTRLLLIGLGMLGFFYFALPRLNELIGIGSPESLISHAAKDSRLKDWAMFAKAALQHPWFGHGWGQITSAQMSVLDTFPDQHSGLFAHTHNILLDLVLALGFPLATLVIGWIGWWLVKITPSLREGPRDGLYLFLALLPIAAHANVEFPHWYAYFLLPAGLILGALEGQKKSSGWIFKTWPIQPRHVGFIWLLLLSAWGATVRDYLHFEQAFYVLRFELARVGQRPTDIEVSPVPVLTHLRANEALIRYEPVQGAPAEILHWAERVTRLYPSGGNVIKLATLYGLNHQPEKASYWLRRACVSLKEPLCQALARDWHQRQKKYPELLSIAWPDIKGMRAP